MVLSIPGYSLNGPPDASELLVRPNDKASVSIAFFIIYSFFIFIPPLTNALVEPLFVIFECYIILFHP